MIRLPIEGEHFGRYRLLGKLGQGGMGVVYRARDTTLDREVAVKLVAPHLAGDEDFRARFQHEAAVLARLESPRIVRIYDHGEQDGVLYLVTQLIQGGDLLRMIQREGSLPPALATSVLGQVVEGLCDAHAVGVVHRDIKPANVLLHQRGREVEAFLCDFGIATTPGADLSRTGTVAGSLPYMAPERHQGADAGPQGDVYAAGCLLWHALTGSAPYAGTDVEVAMAHLQAPIPQLPGKDPYSGAVNAMLRRAMAKDRARRYPTARAMQRDLTAAAALAPDAITLPGATAIRQQVVIGARPRPGCRPPRRCSPRSRCWWRPCSRVARSAATTAVPASPTRSPACCPREWPTRRRPTWPARPWSSARSWCRAAPPSRRRPGSPVRSRPTRPRRARRTRPPPRTRPASRARRRSARPARRRPPRRRPRRPAGVQLPLLGRHQDLPVRRLLGPVRASRGVLGLQPVRRPGVLVVRHRRHRL